MGLTINDFSFIMIIVGEYVKKTIFFLLILFSFNVWADTCKTDELKRLKELASNVVFKTNYEIKTTDGVNYAEYTITAYNLNKELKTLVVWDYYAGKYQEFKYNDSKEATLGKFIDGEKVKISIYAYTANACSGKEVSTKIIKMPYYNDYYDEDFCSRNPDFEYCLPVVEKKITKNTYDKALKKYLYIDVIEDETKEENNNKTNLWIIMGSIIGLIIIVVFFIFMNQRRKKSAI